MRKREKKVLIGFLAVIVVALILFFLIRKPTIETIVDKGVSLKALIVDENGNIKQDLTETLKPTFSIISLPIPSGYLAISPYDCISGCSFLALETKLNNVGGDSEVTITDVTGSNPCASGNTNPGCTGIANVLGIPTTAGNRRGNLDALWDINLPSIIPIGLLGPTVISNGMALDEIAFGLIDFRVDASGTFLDPFGNPQPLTGKFGTLQLKIASSTCSDGTVVDPDSSDADVSGYCSTVNLGKYCRVGSEGQPTLTDRASLCGCPANQLPNGEICQAVSCTPGTCINGIYKCLSDGKSLQEACNFCLPANCPVVDGKSATGCINPTDPSGCQYPLTESGFLVQFSSVSIPPIPSCGDGIKSGTEQCDKNDFGGQSCTSIPGGFSGGTLICNADCTYNTGACMSAYIKFRTSSLTYPASGWISFEPACSGLQLTSYGYSTSGSGGISSVTCDTSVTGISGCSGAIKLLDNLPGGWMTGGSNPSLWQCSTVKLICDDDGVGEAGYNFKKYSSSDSDRCQLGHADYPNCVSATSVPAYSDRETSC